MACRVLPNHHGKWQSRKHFTRTHWSEGNSKSLGFQTNATLTTAVNGGAEGSSCETTISPETVGRNGDIRVIIRGAFDDIISIKCERLDGKRDDNFVEHKSLTFKFCVISLDVDGTVKSIVSHVKVLQYEIHMPLPKPFLFDRVYLRRWCCIYLSHSLFSLGPFTDI